MNANVPLEVVVQVKPGSTNVTGEWFLPRVDNAVSLQSGSSSVRPVAHCAYERSDPSVFPLMHSQGVSVLERLLTHVTLIFFGICVYHLMEAKSVFTLKFLPTFLTAERPLL